MGFPHPVPCDIIQPMNVSLIALSCALLYFAAGFATGLRLFSAPDSYRPPRAFGIALGFAAVILHAWLLHQGLLIDGGINLSFFNTLSLATWLVVLLLLISSLSKPVENLGIVLLPLAGISLLLAERYSIPHAVAVGADWGLRLHILVSLLAYSLLAMASVQAILLAIQNRQLRHHHPGGFIRALPPLQTMESLLFEMILVGFLLLTVSLLSGFMFLENMFAQHLVHKTVLSILSWGVFGVLLWGRFRFGWRGKIAIRWTLVGFVVLLLAYFGSKAVLELMLQR